MLLQDFYMYLWTNIFVDKIWFQSLTQENNLSLFTSRIWCGSWTVRRIGKRCRLRTSFPRTSNIEYSDSKPVLYITRWVTLLKHQNVLVWCDAMSKVVCTYDRLLSYIDRNIFKIQVTRRLHYLPLFRKGAALLKSALTELETAIEIMAMSHVKSRENRLKNIK